MADIGGDEVAIYCWYWYWYLLLISVLIKQLSTADIGMMKQLSATNLSLLKFNFLQSHYLLITISTALQLL